MAKTKRILWLAPAPHAAAISKVHDLKKHGFSLVTVKDLPTLLAEADKERAAFIFISDTAEDSSIIEAIRITSQNPNTKSAKFILICERYSSKSMLAAALQAFRGLLSIDLPSDLWHFILSVQGKPKLPISGLVGLNYLCKIHVPARLIWLNKTHLRLECSLKAHEGDSLNLLGALSHYFGQEQLELVVTKVEQNQLLYRFSYAYECSLPKELEPDVYQQILRQIKPNLASAPVRIFGILKDRKLRHLLSHAFQDEPWELTMALNLKSMLSEPSYLTPDVIFMEESYFSEWLSRIPMLLDSITRPSKFVVLKKIRSVIPSKLGNHEIHFLNTDESLFSAQALRDMCPKTPPDSDEWYFGRKDLNSYGQIALMGRLHGLHPLYVQISSPLSLSEYAMCQVDTPLLHDIFPHPTWVKIVTSAPNLFSSKNPESLFLHEGILSVTTQDQRKYVAESCLLTAQKHLSKFIFTPEGAPALTESEEEDIDYFSSSLPTKVEEETKAPTKPWRSSIKHKISSWERSLETLRYFLIALVLTGLVIYFITLIFPKIAEHLEKSGKVYTEQLELFKGQK